MSYPYYGMIIGSVYLLFVVLRRVCGEGGAAGADGVMITFLLTFLLAIYAGRDSRSCFALR